MLVRLTYASRASESLGAAQLQALCHEARSANAARGITGLLCHCEGIYMQVLEGGREAVNLLYARIVADPRHTRVELLSYAEAKERRFAGWSMGQVNMSRLNPALLLKYSETTGFNPYALSANACEAILDDMVASASIVCQP